MPVCQLPSKHQFSILYIEKTPKSKSLILLILSYVDIQIILLTIFSIFTFYVFSILKHFACVKIQEYYLHGIFSCHTN